MRDSVKELVEKTTKDLGLKAEHLFAAKGADLGESLKTFLEEHPEIVFDYAILGGMGVHAEAEKEHHYHASRLATSMLTHCVLNIVLIP